MSDSLVPASRRGFLRALTALPLIGGSVALIGRPTAVAAPVTLPLLTRYADWLAEEYGEALIEMSGLKTPHAPAFAMHWRREWCQANTTLNPNPLSDRFASAPVIPASSRAALVLSAVGCDWQGGGR